MRNISKRAVLILGGISAFSLGGYIIISFFTQGIGFPLDDAWIHQTYARNLALYGEWTFIPGKISGGSTSPLWSSLLAIGHLMKLGPYVGTYFLSWLSIWGMSVVGMWIFNIICPWLVKYGVWIGILLSMEWHLAWSAGSGMETLLFALIMLLTLGILLMSPGYANGWVIIGGLIGISVWLRPDGLTLFGPVLLVLFTSVNKGKWLNVIIKLFLGFAILFVPYLSFNQMVAGSWWPNTFFAKQAEYAILQGIPLIIRMGRLFKLPLVGVGVSLLPGTFITLIDSIRNKRWDLMAIFLWMSGFVVLYAWRLPVTYQHGRYVIPMMPVYLIFSFSGFIKWITKEGQTTRSLIISKSWTGIVLTLTVLFWILGAKGYSQDVAFVETEMVEVAEWLCVNTPTDTIIAAHDIGAIGYFGNRNILDMAGLISPDVIPFIQDEEKLGNYLETQGAQYLVTFPSWYPEMVSKSVLIYQTSGDISPSLGGENIAVYRWSSP